MKVQINNKISTKNYKKGEFTKEIKGLITKTFMSSRNWEDREYTTHLDFYRDLVENFFTFRFGCKDETNKKISAKDEIYAIALDLDNMDDGGASVAKTKAFASEYDHIFYYSPSGDPNQDRTPHRLILFFKTPVSIPIAESYAKQCSFELQGKSICFDATRIWFPLMPHTMQYSDCGFGKGLESLPLLEDFTKPKKKIIETNNKNDRKDNKDEGIRIKLNKILASKALELGFETFLNKIDLSNVKIIESSRDPEGEAIARYDVCPPYSDSHDRVNCNYKDNVLLFFDRRDGDSGYTGSFLKFLLKCSGSDDLSYSAQIEYSKKLFTILGLEFPLMKSNKKLDPVLVWIEFLMDNKDNLIFIESSQDYGFYNGKFWKIYQPERLVETIFIDWSMSIYGLLDKSIISAIKGTLRTITYNKIKIFNNRPFDRNYYPFNDGLFNLNTRQLESFNSNIFNWNISELNYNDLNLDDGLKAYDKLKELIDKIIIGDEKKKTNFLDGYILLATDHLWKSQSMLWLYGEGGSGKSTLVNWIRDLIGSSSDNGRMVDLRANELFDSPHSLSKIIDGTLINLSEFTFPNNKDAAFLKDIIASGATENSSKPRNGCAIPINEKFKKPYTAFWIGSVVATSQDKPKNDCILDSGWQRRLNYFSFKKINEYTTLYRDIEENLGHLFFVFLHQDLELILKRYNEYFRSPNPETEQQLELELSPVAMFLNETCDYDDSQVMGIRTLYHEFNNKKGEYGYPTNFGLSLANFEKYLNRYLKKFHNSEVFLSKKVKSSHLILRVAIEKTPLPKSNNGKNIILDNVKLSDLNFED